MRRAQTPRRLPQARSSRTRPRTPHASRRSASRPALGWDSPAAARLPGSAAALGLAKASGPEPAPSLPLTRAWEPSQSRPSDRTRQGQQRRTVGRLRWQGALSSTPNVARTVSRSVAGRSAEHNGLDLRAPITDRPAAGERLGSPCGAVRSIPARRRVNQLSCPHERPRAEHLTAPARARLEEIPQGPPPAPAGRAVSPQRGPSVRRERGPAAGGGRAPRQRHPRDAQPIDLHQPTLRDNLNHNRPAPKLIEARNRDHLTPSKRPLAQINPPNHPVAEPYPHNTTACTPGATNANAQASTPPRRNVAPSDRDRLTVPQKRPLHLPTIPALAAHQPPVINRHNHTPLPTSRRPIPTLKHRNPRETICPPRPTIKPHRLPISQIRSNHPLLSKSLTPRRLTHHQLKT